MRHLPTSIHHRGVALRSDDTAGVRARVDKSKGRLLAASLDRLARAPERMRAAVRALRWSFFETTRGAGAGPSRGDNPRVGGWVALVGAGPGDPELLTCKANQLIQRADVVLHDCLVDRRVLDLARRGALVVEVGKSPGGPAWTQVAINQEMVAHANAGKAVVRLKSGDPMMFGRADEELDALEAAGVTFQVVPGISAANAAASRIEASLTQRGRNSAITFLTGQDTKGYAEQDWRALARSDATFAVYMGVRAARFLQGRLLLHGRCASTPVTIAVNVSRPDELILSGQLGTLGAVIDAHRIHGPAIIYVGIAPRRAAPEHSASVFPSFFQQPIAVH